MAESTGPNGSAAEGEAELSQRSRSQHRPVLKPAGAWAKQNIAPAIVAGVISLSVSLIASAIQNNHADQQAQSEHQIQAIQTLESAATAQFNATSSIYQFLEICVASAPGRIWPDCVSSSPQYVQFSNRLPELDADIHNVQDASSEQLADNFEQACGDVLLAKSKSAGEQAYQGKCMDTYFTLIYHLGQLIQEH